MSTFTDFRDRENSQKIAVVEIDVGEAQSFWLPAEAGIWKFKLVDARENVIFNFQNGLFTQGSFENAGTSDLGLNDKPKMVGNLKVAGEDYTAVTTFANLRSTNKSFLYDTDTTLYVHFDNWDPPSVFSPILIGVSHGFSSQEKYFAADLYEGRLKAVPSISLEKDPLYFGLISFDGGTISLRNEDAYFDTWKDTTKYVYGQEVRIKFGGDALTAGSYYTLFTGFVDGFSINNEECVVEVADDKKLFSRGLPVSIFDTTSYPNIKPRNSNKPIPLAYGTCTNALIICNDENAGSAENSYNFTICDVVDHAAGIQAINQIYIDKGDGPVAASAASQSLTAATFVLSGGSAVTQYEPGDDVTADIEGYASGGAVIGNGLHIITDILSVYLDKTYNADIYDTTEWASAQAVAFDCGVWIEDKSSIVDVVEELSLSNRGNFIVKGDGKYSFRIKDNDRATAKTITREHQLTQPGGDWKTDEFLTSVIINYDKDQKEDDFIPYPDTTRQSTVFGNYGKYNEKEFNTVISGSADAAALGSAVMDISEVIVPTFSTTTKTQNIDLVLMDNIILQVDRMQSVWFGDIKAEVVGITYNLDDFTVGISARYIEDA